MIGERYDFELVTTLDDARKMIALERFNVVIQDLGLPDGFGWDLLPFLKKQKPAPKAVILSGAELSNAEARKVEVALLKSRVSPRELPDAINVHINSSNTGENKS